MPHADKSQFVQIDWADVADDGRVLQASASGRGPQSVTPLSSLHLALYRMTSLKRLRIFQCRQGLPINQQNIMDMHPARRLSF
ncbi:hypothetical protein A0H81_00939 [Grifola frondosa]|uniref:Uncharacterized protein n=1 Tax=Grifola frondosa TaxID=5627 RepID=A0A1C7MU48_GRIFR|nr:hypothetical protein A0H81_00939 [Grifola frondosa]